MTTIDRSAAAAEMGRARSERKTATARENGRKGGRPVTAYECDHEWSGWKITKTSTAWVYTQWSRVQGTLDGLKARLPFSAAWPADLNLTNKWNDTMTVGERLAYEIKGSGTVIDKGRLVA